VPATAPATFAGSFTAPNNAPRFHFKIDPNTPLQDLLPVPPKAGLQTEPLLTEDLARVPEARLLEPWSRNLGKEKGLEQTAHTIARINHLNGKQNDGFLKTLVHHRPDLTGLSFAMDDACRTKGERSQYFKIAATTVRRVLQQSPGGAVTSTIAVPSVKMTRLVREPVPPVPLPADATSPTGAVAAQPAAPGGALAASPADSIGPVFPPPPVDRAANVVTVQEAVQTPVQVPGRPGGRETAEAFWEQYREACAQEDSVGDLHDRAHCEMVSLTRVAALMQVLAPESPGLRLGLVRYLAGISHVEATKALAKLALFSAEEEVRSAALDALQVRRERDYTEILLKGFHYPLAAVARRAAEALVKLERKDLVPQLVALLDEPDPRAPVVQEVNGKKVPVIRELVRLNHHQSCLLCHSPGNTPTVSPEALTASVPVPDEPLPSPSQGYNDPSIPDILVRVDVTYLRQDFSVRLPVADAHPWPEMQRFDFLVRSRQLTEQQAKAYREELTSREPGHVPPHRRAVLAALRELTGRDTEPTSQAWRKLLSVAEPPRQANGAE
jgi:hypothetical protein